MLRKLLIASFLLGALAVPTRTSIADPPILCDVQTEDPIDVETDDFFF